MPSKREWPRDFDPDPEENLDDRNDPLTLVGHSEFRPLDQYAALMACAPFVDPDKDRTELLRLRDTIVDALDNLDEADRDVFDALYTRRLSLRQYQRECGIPKSTLARRRSVLLIRLRMMLQHDPLIAEYLERP